MPNANDSRNALHELEHHALSTSESEEHRYVLAVPSELPVLAAHFPGSPIVPAFVELREVVGRAASAWPRLGAWRGASALKFQAPIRPGDRLELRLRRAEGTERVRFTIVITDGSAPGTRCAVGTLLFEGAQEPA
ncbi:hypothetical protein [Paraliomyxa miuraensis]|uniref:hypothetical protein n=1 Tax=Paraliomyxa miuraensis TaxID=376150 RepID=UPI0022537D1E|nr:hypothetical protein [Paraliomyxa miuraensis]MCX4247047.1 hypothetical protein [Paraliomyxa miuraensis]